MFKDFGRRLKRDLKKKFKGRCDANIEILKSRGITNEAAFPKPLEPNVISHQMQRYAVWFGGSIISSGQNFQNLCKTKAQYEEEGPRIMRNNVVFGTD